MRNSEPKGGSRRIDFDTITLLKSQLAQSRTRSKCIPLKILERLVAVVRKLIESPRLVYRATLTIRDFLILDVGFDHFTRPQRGRFAELASTVPENIVHRGDTWLRLGKEFLFGSWVPPGNGFAINFGGALCFDCVGPWLRTSRFGRGTLSY